MQFVYTSCGDVVLKGKMAIYMCLNCLQSFPEVCLTVYVQPLWPLKAIFSLHHDWQKRN